MAGRKRTKAQREADFQRIAEMHALGKSQTEIAAALGLTQQQISLDLKVIYRRWSEPEKENLHATKARMLAEIKAHKDMCRKAWEKSQDTKEITTQKQVKTPRAVAGEGEDAQPEEDKERNEASLRIEERDGNPAFLKSIEWCIDRECKLRGLDAPQKMELDVLEPVKILRVVNSSRDNPWTPSVRPAEQPLPKGVSNADSSRPS
jgi:hypothetical protein